MQRALCVVFDGEIHGNADFHRQNDAFRLHCRRKRKTPARRLPCWRTLRTTRRRRAFSKIAHLRPPRRQSCRCFPQAHPERRARRPNSASLPPRGIAACRLLRSSSHSRLYRAFEGTALARCSQQLRGRMHEKGLICSLMHSASSLAAITVSRREIQLRLMAYPDP